MYSGLTEALQSDKNRYLFRGSATVCSLIAMSDAIDDEMQDVGDGGTESRTELDSHANMPVVGRNAFILSETGCKAEVSAYTPDYEPKKIPIVDAAVLYECPYQGTAHILVIRNALYVPTMMNNLIPPFVMRKAGIVVNDRPKIHSDDPDVEDHSIYFPEVQFWIPLSLFSVFSGFATSKPDENVLQQCDEVYLLTPSRWNPHDIAYGTNEDGMMDWQGEMIERKHQRQVLLSDVKQDDAMAASLEVSSTEASVVDVNLERSDESSEVVRPLFRDIPKQCDQVSSILAEVDLCLNDKGLYQRLEARAQIGDFMMAVGATTAARSPFIDDDEVVVETVNDDDESNGMEIEEELETEEFSSEELEHEDDNEDAWMNEIFEKATAGDLDFDEIMTAGAAHAGRSQGVDAEHLSKVWRISPEEAKRTLDITTQEQVHTDNPSLSRNFGTNDRMLRYKRIKAYFFMDTFYATKKAGKSTRGHTCCQLFVTDKGFVYVVPMRSKADVMAVVKQFAKEVGAPDAIISDAAGEQKLKELRKFCSEIGTMLRVLEEGTPWANKAELYIGIIKEAVRKDMKESNCPLPFWDYCVERRARINNLTAKDRFNLHGLNAHTTLTGEEADISNLCKFGWYEWCYYREQGAKFPFNREVLGRVLGPATGAGNKMAQWVLKANGVVVPRHSLRPLQVAELHNMEEKEK